MRFSYGKFGGPIPKKIKFTAIGLTSTQAADRVAKKATAWLELHKEDIIVYRMKSKTSRVYLGLVYRTNHYVFYKDNPR